MSFFQIKSESSWISLELTDDERAVFERVLVRNQQQQHTKRSKFKIRLCAASACDDASVTAQRAPGADADVASSLQRQIDPPTAAGAGLSSPPSILPSSSSSSSSSSFSHAVAATQCDNSSSSASVECSALSHCFSASATWPSSSSFSSSSSCSRAQQQLRVHLVATTAACSADAGELERDQCDDADNDVSPLADVSHLPADWRAVSTVAEPFRVEATSGKYTIFVQDEFHLRDGRGTVKFEARTTNDIHVCFARTSECVEGSDGLIELSPAYEVVIGGWNNTKSAIRKHGQKVCTSSSAAARITSSHAYDLYWISLDMGYLVVGRGRLGDGVFLRWQDQQPEYDLSFVGVAAWNNPVTYRNLSVSAPIMSPLRAPRIDASIDLLNRRDFSDLVFVCADRVKVYAHCVVMAGWSPSTFPLSDLSQESNAAAPATSLSDSAPLSRPASPAPCASSSSSSSSAAMIGRMLSHAAYINSQWRLKEGGQRVKLYRPELNSALLVDVLRYLYGGKLRCSRRDVDALSTTARSLGIGVVACVLHAAAASSDDEVLEVRATSAEWPFEHLYNNALMSDAEFLVDDERFYGHRVLLAAVSPPFSAMFRGGLRESHEREICIHGTNAASFAAALYWIYTRRMPELKSVADAIQVALFADRFELHSLCKRCIQFCCAHVAADSCLWLLELARLFNYESMRASAFEYMQAHARDVLAAGILAKLDECTLAHLLRSDHFSADEYELFEAVLAWRQEHIGDPQCRVSVARLLSLLRYPFMDVARLRAIANMAVVAENARLRRLVSEALRMKQAPSTQPPPSSTVVVTKDTVMVQRPPFRLAPRVRPPLRMAGWTAHELLFSFSGDAQGLVHWLGTSGGVRRFENPHRAGLLTVSASSPVSRYTQPERLVARGGAVVCFASRSAASAAWWQVDVGDERLLRCTDYSLRADSSMSLPRNWELRASSDGDEFVTLKVHSNEPTMQRGGDIASWRVPASASGVEERPYRFFRIVATSPASDGANVLAVSGIEFYGILFTRDAR